jgi:hypothetical protein
MLFLCNPVSRCGCGMVISDMIQSIEMSSNKYVSRSYIVSNLVCDRNPIKVLYNQYRRYLLFNHGVQNIPKTFSLFFRVLNSVRYSSTILIGFLNVTVWSFPGLHLNMLTLVRRGSQREKLLPWISKRILRTRDSDDRFYPVGNGRGVGRPY